MMIMRFVRANEIKWCLSSGYEVSFASKPRSERWNSDGIAKRDCLLEPGEIDEDVAYLSLSPLL